MGAGILRVHGRGVEWLPGGIALRVRIPVEIAIADRRDRSPKVITVFGIKNCNVGIRQGRGVHRHKARAVEEFQMACRNDLPSDGVIGLRAGHEPEPRRLGFLGGSPAAVARPVGLDLVVVSSPLLARERRRWSGPELVGTLEHKGLELRPGRANHGSRRNVDPGLGQRTLWIRSGGAVMASGIEYFQSDALTKLPAGCQCGRVAVETLEVFIVCRRKSI